jgi:hypothetical protein
LEDAIVSDILLPSFDVDTILLGSQALGAAFETQSSVASRHSRNSVHTSSHVATGIIIPSDSSLSGVGGIMEMLESDRPSSVLPKGDEVLLDEIDFEFDHEGNFVERPKNSTAPQTPRLTHQSQAGSDTSAQVRRDHQLPDDEGSRVSESRL